MMNENMASDSNVSFTEVLTSIDRAIKDLADGDGVQSYKIAGRELSKYSAEELLKLRQYYQQRVNDEEAATAGRSRFKTDVVEIC